MFVADAAAPDVSRGLDVAATDAVEDTMDAVSIDAPTDAADRDTPLDMPVDAAPDVALDSAADSTSDTQDPDARTCHAACDCPAGTICTIDGVCTGSACTPTCDDGTPCSCGRACVGGYCDLPAGSLAACSHDCECPHHEVCGNGRCVRGCHALSGVCTSDADCAACGLVCEPFGGLCTTVGHGCFCAGDCAAWGLAGQMCDGVTRNCTTPAGTPVDIAGGTFVAGVPGELTLTADATLGAGDAVTRVGVVMDLDASTDFGIDIALQAPDGSRHLTTLAFGCRGPVPQRWVGILDLHTTPLVRAGTWHLSLNAGAVGTTIPVLHHGWAYFGP